MGRTINVVLGFGATILLALFLIVSVKGFTEMSILFQTFLFFMKNYICKDLK